MSGRTRITLLQNRMIGRGSTVVMMTGDGASPRMLPRRNGNGRTKIQEAKMTGHRTKKKRITV